MDGGYSDNVPVFNGNTITVSPFSGDQVGLVVCLSLIQQPSPSHSFYFNLKILSFLAIPYIHASLFHFSLTQ